MWEKRLQFMGIQATVAMDAARAERLKRTALYRGVARPVLNRWRARRTPPAVDGRQEAAPAPAAPSAPASPEARAIQDRIDTVEWYHSIDLPHGVSTAGLVDHRTQVPLYGLPADMRGMRALDVATYDGFWAFEMERRGAEVVAIDLASLADCDYPARFRHHALTAAAGRKLGEAFSIAHDLLGSRVARREMSVYDLSPERVGSFDVVFLSDLLLHLRDGALAIERICSVTRPGGFAIVAEPFNEALDAAAQPLSQFGFGEAVGWWHHSSNTLKTMMYFAGFDDVEEISRFRLISRVPVPLTKVVLRGRPAPLTTATAS